MLDIEFRMKSWFYHGKRPVTRFDRLTLQPEPRNSHDSNAVKILKNGRMVGYVDRRYSCQIASALDRGVSLHVGVAVESCASEGMPPYIRIRDDEAYYAAIEERERPTSFVPACACCLVAAVMLSPVLCLIFMVGCTLWV